MTTASTAHLIGRTGRLKLVTPRLIVDVSIVDVRSNLGRVDVQVHPVAGSAAAWVDLASVTLDEPETGR